MTSLSTNRIPMAILRFTLLAALCAPVALARGEVHLRVEVTDEDSGEMRVQLDMPLTSIESLLDVLASQMHGAFNMDFGQHGLGMRRIYRALRDEDMTDFLQIHDGDKHVKIWKDQNAFQVRVTRDGDSRPVVSVYLPLTVLDALFSGPDESPLALQFALEELKQAAPLTLVEVYDDQRTVKIWLE